MFLEISIFMLWVLAILGVIRLLMWVLKIDRPREIYVPVERNALEQDWVNKHLS